MAGCHTLLICAHPCNLWEAFSARRFCVFCVFCGTLSPRLLVYERGSILPRNSRNSRNVRLRYWRRGYGRMPYPPNLCASVPICGRLSLPEGSVCSAYSVGHSLFALLVHLWAAHLRWFPSATRSDCVRRPIRLRSPPNQIASAARSDCVRRPIRLRSPSDQIPSAARCHK